ncbi:putative hydro-lyase [Microbulbifer halophilus]|uniref:Hydro-lyase n=1 Tax=Microbulbifer halophilus TaxID=453963 RepID=A0ABW5EEP3_9GAMM|nr:putative hydro-lyase [Microbulbifer halophilus]MCW8127764.1 putative hydro-lyase [Microbulbifer halophilus]
MIRHCAKVIRSEIRAGRTGGPTSGLAAGYVQAGVAIVPASHADDFARFCAANPASCPLLYRSEPGRPLLAPAGDDIDVRSDLPRYRVYRKNRDCEEVTDITGHWRDDLVTFLLGCSFSFEEALITAGLEVRNISTGKNIPIYRTAIACTPSGPFSANLAVSMRPFGADQLNLVHSISGRYPLLHGEPVSAGDPQHLGIADLREPDFGDAVSIAEGEEPVFWACSATACEALQNAGLDFCVTHSPGHMLVTDRLASKMENISAGTVPAWNDTAAR